MKVPPAANTSRPAKWTRENIKAFIVSRFHTRTHMSLILASSGLAAMIGNWVMLHAGIHAMWVRYPIAVSLAYLTFLAGVWLWLRFMGMQPRSSIAGSSSGNIDLPNFSSGGGSSGGSGINLSEGLGKGGGEFGGGGASGSWTGAGQTQMFAAGASTPQGGGSSSPAISSKGFGKLDFDLDGDAVVLLILAALLIGSILLLSGYIVWMAPDILSEAAFGATLAGGLAKQAQGHGSEGWAEAVIRKTWWPFAIVLVVSLAFAIFAAINYPGARTFGQAISMALNG